MSFIKGPEGILRASTTPSRFSIWGPELGRALRKKRFPFVFYSGCPLQDGKQQGSAFGTAPLGFVVFHLVVEIRNKKLMEIVFLLRPGPTFGPKLKTDFGWCWPLIKNTQGP